MIEKPSREEAVFDVRATPSAKKDAVWAEEDTVCVKTRAPPDNQRANRAILKLLRPYFGRCRIISGLKSRKKTVKAENISYEEYSEALKGLGEAKRR